MDAQVVSPWVLTNGRYEIGVARDYPGSWTNVDERFDPEPRGLFIAAGEVTPEQLALLEQDSRYPSADGLCLKGAKYFATPDNIKALLTDASVQPGDRLIMRGHYEGDYDCSLIGSAEHPIVIDATGATLNGTLHLLAIGRHVVLQGLEGYWDGWTTRVSTYDGPLYPPPDIEHPQSQSGGVQVHMPHVTLRHGDFHDWRTNVGTWEPAESFRMEWCHSYHAGFYSTKSGDHAHGEGWYVGGVTGERIAEACIFHDNGDHGPIPYTTNAPLGNVHVRRCTIYNDELQFGGQQPMSNVGMSGSLTYATNDIIVGFGNIAHKSAYLRDNVLCMAPNHLRGLWVQRVEQLTVTGNIIVGNENTYPVVIQRPPANWSDWTWNNNRYAWIPRANAGQYNGAAFYVEGYGALDFDQWRNLTGYDTDSTFEARLPEDIINVRVSPYQPEAHVTIYNFSLANTQAVTLDGLPFGSYRAVSTMNKAEGFDIEWAGEPMSFRMTGWTNGTPIAWAQPLEKSTAPQFMCWIVRAL